jgi:hypothetical protein
VAAGWADPEIVAEARRIFEGWYALIGKLTEEACDLLGGLGPFTMEDVKALIGVHPADVLLVNHPCQILERTGGLSCSENHK